MTAESAVRALPIAGERIVGDESIVVTSPFDGSEIGRVPSCTAADVDRAVASARAALRAGPLPRWKRAEVLDTAARLLAEREEEFARIIAAEAAKPIRTARAEAQRAVGTLQFAAAEARTFDGDVVPLDAIPSGEGKVGFTMRVPIGVVGRSPRSTSRSTLSPTSSARRSPPVARSCSSRRRRRRSARSPSPSC